MNLIESIISDKPGKLMSRSILNEAGEAIKTQYEEMQKEFDKAKDSHDFTAFAEFIRETPDWDWDGWKCAYRNEKQYGIMPFIIEKCENNIKGAIDALAALIEIGANPDVGVRVWYTSGTVPAIELLLNNGYINKGNWESAAATVKMLIDAGVKPDPVIWNNSLFKFLKNGQTGMFEKLDAIVPIKRDAKFEKYLFAAFMHIFEELSNSDDASATKKKLDDFVSKYHPNIKKHEAEYAASLAEKCEHTLTANFKWQYEYYPIDPYAYDGKIIKNAFKHLNVPVIEYLVDNGVKMKKLSDGKYPWEYCGKHLKATYDDEIIKFIYRLGKRGLTDIALKVESMIETGDIPRVGHRDLKHLFERRDLK